jgi:23S rRNA (cytidine1920-2'-O)/16S rRNA (cytidine1409-2'-O)-methyltransferase
VVVLEGVNARNLNPEQFTVRFDLATVDVSFISLIKILPPLHSCLAEGSDCIALIKPQFEVGKGEVGRGGIVTDAAKHRRVLKEITGAALGFGFHPVGLIDSPILGAEGNREFLMHLKTGGDDGDDTAIIHDLIDSLTG